jgi:hypothetical protein
MKYVRHPYLGDTVKLFPHLPNVGVITEVSQDHVYVESGLTNALIGRDSLVLNDPRPLGEADWFWII